MGQRSFADSLDPKILDELNAAIKRGATIDEIKWMLKGMGADVSRSAVGRYSKQYSDLASRQRDMASVAKAFASEFGGEDDQQGRLMVQLVTSLITRSIMPVAAGEIVDEEVDYKDLHFLARAVKDVTSAAKTDVDREAKIRDEASKRAKRDAAQAAESTARAAGATPETIEAIKKSILGLT